MRLQRFAQGYWFSISLHEDVIESVRRSGSNGNYWVQRYDGSRMTLVEIEPDNDTVC